MSTPQDTQTNSLNRQVVGKLLVMVAVMFAFGYAMVPIYKKICEVTGVNFLTQPEDSVEQFVKNTQVDSSRKVAVVFDSNSRGAWQFKPERNSVSVHPGELVTIVYELVNTADRPTTGQAIPSYAPGQAKSYFKKIQCFCFEQQTLQANGKRKFPVVFVVDPKLPKDINAITLSYTFFEIEGISVSQASKGPGDS